MRRQKCRWIAMLFYFAPIRSCVPVRIGCINRPLSDKMQITASAKEGWKMEFTFETQYNAKSMAFMAKALRKTVRKKHSRRSHIFGWVVMFLALLLLVSKGVSPAFPTIVTSIVILAILIVFLFEDRINGAVAKKRLLPGTEKAVTVFSESGFFSTTDIGRSEWNYDKIVAIAETDDFFVFIFSANHAQLYDKRNMQGGTADDFRRFIEATTGKRVQPIG